MMNEVKVVAAQSKGLVMEIRVGGVQHGAIQSEEITRKFGDKMVRPNFTQFLHQMQMKC
jgi:hypothetical protein